MRNPTTARIFQDGETVGPLDSFQAVMVRPASFRPGMLLVDPELGTPVYSLDHRVRSTRNSGAITWLVEDMERGGYQQVPFTPAVLIPVAAK